MAVIHSRAETSDKEIEWHVVGETGESVRHGGRADGQAADGLGGACCCCSWQEEAACSGGAPGQEQMGTMKSKRCYMDCLPPPEV
ncbi:hypothetical protein EYF80_016717 [Liparis tanakae]|uniref:Uncharacterized protein n=1 Tax=Liparis tanakae TaxID=230148 RepID=A0A4Z2I4W1_9TELE|nr:hypothetical protein EYF80_016717 [Liparis tanakae]